MANLSPRLCCFMHLAASEKSVYAISSWRFYTNFSAEVIQLDSCWMLLCSLCVFSSVVSELPATLWLDIKNITDCRTFSHHDNLMKLNYRFMKVRYADHKFILVCPRDTSPLFYAIILITANNTITKSETTGNFCSKNIEFIFLFFVCFFCCCCFFVCLLLFCFYILF